MNKKSINNSLKYALALVNGGYHSTAPAYSIDKVQTALDIVGRLPKADKIFRSQHIVPIGSAIDFMFNDYLLDHVEQSRYQADDLRVTRKAHGNAYIQYHFVYDEALGRDRLTCTLINVAELEHIVKLIRHANGLDKNIIKVTDNRPF